MMLLPSILWLKVMPLHCPAADWWPTSLWLRLCLHSLAAEVRFLQLSMMFLHVLVPLKCGLRFSG